MEATRLLPGSEGILLSVRGGGFEVLDATPALRALLSDRRGPVANTLLERAVASRRAVELDDARDDAALGAALRGAGLARVRALPLLTRGLLARDVVGALVVARPGDTPFSVQDVRVLDAFAALVALSLVRTEQRSDAEQNTSRLALGVDLALDLGAAPTPPEVTQRLLARAIDAAGADRATLFRVEGGWVELEATRDVDAGSVQPGLRIAIDAQPALQRAIATRRPVRGVPMVLEELPQPLRTALSDIEQIVVLPLVLAGEVIGFLNVYRRSDRSFDDGDVATLHMIGNVAAVTLRNSRLLAGMQAARQTMGDFLSVVVHELRAPLTIIGGYVDMMREGVIGETPAVWGRPLEVVDAKVHEAQRLVDELLLVARLDSGDLPRRIVDIDVSAAAQRAVQRALPRAQLLHAAIDVDISAAVMVRADAGHVDRILDNLINNALVHGGSPARVQVAVHGGPPVVSVADSGDGVAGQDRDHIFERFYRGANSSPGTGLGLFISRQLAEASGGSLDLDEGTDAGARFVLRLPAVTGRARSGTHERSEARAG